MFSWKFSESKVLVSTPVHNRIESNNLGGIPHAPLKQHKDFTVCDSRSHGFSFWPSTDMCAGQRSDNHSPSRRQRSVHRQFESLRINLHIRARRLSERDGISDRRDRSPD